MRDTERCVCVWRFSSRFRQKFTENPSRRGSASSIRLLPRQSAWHVLTSHSVLRSPNCVHVLGVRSTKYQRDTVSQLRGQTVIPRLRCAPRTPKWLRLVTHITLISAAAFVPSGKLATSCSTPLVPHESWPLGSERMGLLSSKNDWR